MGMQWVNDKFEELLHQLCDATIKLIYVVSAKHDSASSMSGIRRGVATLVQYIHTALNSP